MLYYLDYCVLSRLVVAEVACTAAALSGSLTLRDTIRGKVSNLYAMPKVSITKERLDYQDQEPGTAHKEIY